MTGTAQFAAETTSDGRWRRQRNHFTGRVTADGSSGWPVEAGRYRLVVSLACPWAHRAVVVRRLLGLEAAISLAVVDPVRDERGWRFTLDEGSRDPVTGVAFLSELYAATDPAYDGRVTVPALVDTSTGQVVTNDYPQLTLDLSTQWRALHAPGAPDLYPEELRGEMDPLMQRVYETVNNGVYRCGFATSQGAYDEAFDALFATLDDLDRRLAGRRFLMGPQVTEADVRLFTTLARFDAVYYVHFKCNGRRLVDYEHLWPYARDLWSIPAFGGTVDLDHVKRHYYCTHDTLNPQRIVPRGPFVDWTEPHGREALGNG